MAASNKQMDNRGAEPLPAGLYVVATPIGNLRDMTLRAIDTLRSVALIACEDTRVTKTLLVHHGIHTPTFSYHDHNTERAGAKIAAEIASGKAVALVSDAGTPLLSDPGFVLVRDLVAAGHTVTPIPGASALTTALMGAGLATDRVLFAGFLPPKSSARRTELSELAGIAATLVFYESPRRLSESLTDMAELLGEDRACTVARELTKRFEEWRRGTLQELAAHYAQADTPKGEVVLVVAPPEKGRSAWDDAALEMALREALPQMSVKDAATLVAARSGMPKKEVYARALALKSESPGT